MFEGGDGEVEVSLCWRIEGGVEDEKVGGRWWSAIKGRIFGDCFEDLEGKSRADEGLKGSADGGEDGYGERSHDTGSDV